MQGMQSSQCSPMGPITTASWDSSFPMSNIEGDVHHLHILSRRKSPSIFDIPNSKYRSSHPTWLVVHTVSVRPLRNSQYKTPRPRHPAYINLVYKP